MKPFWKILCIALALVVIGLVVTLYVGPNVGGLSEKQVGLLQVAFELAGFFFAGASLWYAIWELQGPSVTLAFDEKDRTSAITIRCGERRFQYQIRLHVINTSRADARSIVAQFIIPEEARGPLGLRHFIYEHDALAISGGKWKNVPTGSGGVEWQWRAEAIVVPAKTGLPILEMSLHTEPKESFEGTWELPYQVWAERMGLKEGKLTISISSDPAKETVPPLA